MKLSTFSRTFWFACSMAAFVWSSGAGANQPVAYRVIVHPTNSATTIEPAFLVSAFLGKTTVWPDSQPIHPVDLPTDSATRQRFSSEILRRSVSAVKSYWLHIVFSGRGIPPPELESDQEVVKYVSRVPGSIGYVSGTANVEGTKVVDVR